MIIILMMLVAITVIVRDARFKKPLLVVEGRNQTWDYI